MNLMHWMSFSELSQFFIRLRHPYSLPEDVAKALGIRIPNIWKFERLIAFLTSRRCHPTRLRKFMSRESAEAAFQNATKNDYFALKTLYSYCFKDGTIDFALHFDSQGRLRRLYVHHTTMPIDQSIEIPLSL